MLFGAWKLLSYTSHIPALKSYLLKWWPTELGWWWPEVSPCTSNSEVMPPAPAPGLTTPADPTISWSPWWPPVSGWWWPPLVPVLPPPPTPLPPTLEMGLPSLTKTGTATLRGEFCEVYHEKINQIFSYNCGKNAGWCSGIAFFKNFGAKTYLAIWWAFWHCLFFGLAFIFVSVVLKPNLYLMEEN